ncbi:soluble scavenger receptor cysteine-rich domain-containing protein SSC5D-like [Scylla paramamosain]|uniref:soluble scavenger receptor cysteine-rich domain-containing protein SSC5D-like n=1 Tax=Scylla paramamosain TaxID=85552 RepID=UPI00308342EB
MDAHTTPWETLAGIRRSDVRDEPPSNPRRAPPSLQQQVAIAVVEGGMQTTPTHSTLIPSPTSPPHPPTGTNPSDKPEHLPTQQVPRAATVTPDLPRPSKLTRPYDLLTKAPTHALPFLKRHATTLVLNRQNRPQGPHLDSTTLSESAPHLAPSESSSTSLPVATHTHTSLLTYSNRRADDCLQTSRHPDRQAKFKTNPSRLPTPAMTHALPTHRGGSDHDHHHH